MKFLIERFRLWKLDSTEIGLELTCSKGTYIRTLAADMGNFLRCGAHLKSLRRLACGHLTVERAVFLSDLEALKADGKISLVSLNQAVGHLRAVRLGDHLLGQLRMGQQEVLAGLETAQGGENLIRLIDSKDNLVALTHWVDVTAGGRWRLSRVFST